MTKRIISLLLVFVMIFSVVSLVACDEVKKNNKATEEEEEDTKKKESSSKKESTSDEETEDTGESQDSDESSESDESKDSGQVEESEGSKESEESKEETSDTNKPTNSSNNKTEDVTMYQINKFTKPVWEGDVSYAEAAFVRQNQNGQVDPIQLLYDIDEIISVRSADLKTLYKEGKDYKVEDGKLVILESGSIPVLAYDKYYFPLTKAEHDVDKLQSKVPAKTNGMGYIVAEQKNESTPGMSAWALAVTYRHAEGNCVVSVPADRSDLFAKFKAKLDNKEEVKIVALGDSITHGWSSSANANMAPNCPNYPLIFQDYIRLNYRLPKLKYTNLSYSGKNSDWALNYCNDRKYVPIDKLCELNPDLVFLAFGMNDACGIAPGKFVTNINTMLNKIKEKCPNAMVVVVGTMLPNAEALWSPGGSPILLYHDDYMTALQEAEKNWTNAVFANVTKAHMEMMTVKTYQDTTGSNTNHPNDYFHRVYANVIIQTVFGYKLAK